MTELIQLKNVDQQKQIVCVPVQLVHAVKEPAYIVMIFGQYCSPTKKEDNMLAVNATIREAAENLGFNKSTACKATKWLLDNDYIKDLTPDAGTRHHDYVTTGKINWKEGYIECRTDEIREFGPLPALVLGRIRGFANQEKGVCFASTSKIAESINYSERIVRKVIRLLVSKEKLNIVTIDGKRTFVPR